MKKAATRRLLAPVAGRVLALADVQDPVFATATMGPGFAIQPTDGRVVAPVSGRVTVVAATKHAVGLVTASGLEVLVHMGIDTVELNGAPFVCHVQVGDTVQAGEVLAEMDLAALQRAQKIATVIVVVTNGQTVLDDLIVAATDQMVTAKTAVATAVLAVTPVPGAQVVTPTTAASDAKLESESESKSKSKSKPNSTSKYAALATAIVTNVGGPGNVNSVIHCITRLRFYLKDEHRAQDAVIANLDGVIDVAKAGGQYQVVIGPAVNEVYDAVMAQLGPAFADTTAGTPTATATQAAGAPTETDAPTGWLPRLRHGVSQVIGVMTAAMIPVIGILAGSGILKGILAALTGFHVLTVTSGTYMVLNAVADATFYFLPVVLGFTAAKKLGSDPIVLAIVGAILIYPSLMTAAGHATTAQITFFGVPTHLMSYAASVFPMIVAAWLGVSVERGLKRVIPLYLRSVFVPILEALILSVIVLVVIGPLITMISKGLASGILAIYNFSPALSGLVIGGLYQTMVIFGLHWGIIPIVINDIATNGHSYLNAILSITMVAQGGAVLAVFLKSKNKPLKEISLAAAISAFCGVTEPALYGVNLKYKRVFVVASIASGLGGLLTGLLHVNNYALSGSLIGFPAFITPGVGIGPNFYGYLISHYGTLLIATTLVYLFGFSDKMLPATSATAK
ncbi:glucose PTS transporter subunit IIA [Lactiplantibacillus pentosus]|uniref:PTS system sucrose-specific EIIBCA component n=3 Tax=Lactiplantibacillus pentosus TaxID=1589 RepID=A0AAX6LDE5_LACPE|nr:PTS glucose transporter subunit IIABC [Lactiplantibacillus pentosus]AYJ40656.1 PTS beta-glucoside transporter subunit IIABC [Lactiplantibacillus pentosus]KRK22677.1 pts system, trehalose-specific iibc component [Lactiplantibacillus pentosus DSM 20314]MBU7496377.1 glucose PTS transporter subunit IIA [Lactiplantibacillus pentosus]MCT3300691.1 PTS beta-glucoside transporter subunit IIABC [Lactiplantibacillus pentosus]MCT3329456.1 PTS beta-glucoside transporter subunit IIABC [Lactiplantibacillu